jgi:ribosomal protein S18 acetylase RimI-like enzyme
MGASPIVPVHESERARALDTLVVAFAADPVERWLYPAAHEYLEHFPAFLSAFAGKAFAQQTVWRLGAFAGVAIWLPPNIDVDGDAVVNVLTDTVSPEKLDDTFAVLGQMDTAHPKFAHWYLPWFGVDAAVQSQGFGGQLMTHCLRVIDNDHLPAYLDSPNPRNISFYERHGFVVTGEAQAGTCPPIVSMLRAAQ